MSRDSPLSDWTPEEREAARRWVATWRRAAMRLEDIRRAELRSPDTKRAIALLYGSGGGSLGDTRTPEFRAGGTTKVVHDGGAQSLR